MIQLKKEGWIHHLARHSVACFLTRGDLWISWEEGAAVFDKFVWRGGGWLWQSTSVRCGRVGGYRVP
jgi:cryptochrome